jgi:hypothetical protein
MMGLNVLSGARLYMHNRRQYDDSFPQKKISFCFNHPRNPDVESRSQKVWEFKIF